MSFWTNVSILRMPKKYILLYIIGMMFSSCTFKLVNKSMDISDIIDRREEVEDFVHRNFDSIEYDRLIKPILFHKINFINKTEHLTFCKMNVEQCWVKKSNDLYAFFMVIKTSAEVEKNISARYGKWDTKGSISV